MNKYIKKKAERAFKEISQHLENGILEFWLNNCLDLKYGGFHECFNDYGLPSGNTDKYLLVQTRLIWGFSALCRLYPQKAKIRQAARQGVGFLIKYFWDDKEGGWFCSVTREGIVIDAGKLVYGQSFAIYALAEYTLSTFDPRGLEYAEKTFDLLQKYCVDLCRGGYYENFEKDWTISGPGFAAGDRKTLDTHMHLIEAFTVLSHCSGKEIHRRRLQEVIDIILYKMINQKIGCGMDQFDLDFNPIPSIDLKRIWNPKWATGEITTGPSDITIYGHNVELVWLLNRAGEILGKSSDNFNDITQKLIDHAIRFGFDKETGGIYQFGPHEGPASNKDKEWWPNCEALVGFLDAYIKLGDEKYFDVFDLTWDFDKKYFINQEIGEWRQLLDERGDIISGEIGNHRKAIYHTARAMLECMQRLEKISR